jgi:hypothetical protein
VVSFVNLGWCSDGDQAVSITGGVPTTLLPLLFVLFVTALKDAIEDFNRCGIRQACTRMLPLCSADPQEIHGLLTHASMQVPCRCGGEQPHDPLSIDPG